MIRFLSQENDAVKWLAVRAPNADGGGSPSYAVNLSSEDVCPSVQERAFFFAGGKVRPKHASPHCLPVGSIQSLN
jgi:hypothetical protein